MKTVLIPIPQIDFDPTEVSVPWKVLKENGYKIVFATPSGASGEADFRMVTGKGLGILSPVLKAKSDDVLLYRELEKSNEFLNPKKYESVKLDSFDVLLLPGGHAKGMRIYLESESLQNLVGNTFAEGKPVAAICHGVLLAARSKNPKTKKSSLYGLKTTGLLKSQELLAWNLTRAWLGDYYRTYPTPLQDEVISFLEYNTDFQEGPMPIARDSFSNIKPGFSVLDKSYLSARWPGDAHKFALELPEFFG
ncbi:type 1 glutamine amidotransferase domain-containing protein [Leptospira licerasiae]|uniref:DJ-1/PfpI family protein n=1 Tax=Leptospira licerasiae str. MMD4847 TaxID=1049971 RepID=A0ABP2R8S8_9LEPT|nr:type 1 glutamine amidotransferase domain-containing protein [Leptospira licerasiae]EIE03057.1 DJ-1/PfpI domain protein [Leptospira licerasiae serovar Varillal str. VAR 010]EJZ40816.1 DJ-1/PfpI family protein [Leptospira licerasiae str. MMD4847]